MSTSNPYLLPLLIALPFLLTPYLTLSPVKRETIVRPKDEKVVILGASEGCGKGLVEEYVLNRGASVLIFARTESKLQALRSELIDTLTKTQGLAHAEAEDRILVVAGDISVPSDLVRVRDLVLEKWEKLDTLHIISGLPSTSTIYASLGLELEPTSGSSSRSHRFVPKSGKGDDEKSLPRVEELEELAEEARRVGEVNMTGVILSVGTFLPLLSATSASPLIHHLSSVAALVPAPTRMVYSATKSAGLAAFKTCAVECARDQGNGSGVRFLAVCPGTIDTGFRRKSAGAKKAGGLENKLEGMGGEVGKVLTVQDTVDAIIYHASLPTTSSPLQWSALGGLIKLQIPFLRVPPRDLVVLPDLPYRFGWWVDSTWLRGYLESMGRRKYGLV